jgi:hypothetical protein
MERQLVSRRRILGAGAAALAGATLATGVPTSVLAATGGDLNARLEAINRQTWLDYIIAKGLNGGDASIMDVHTTPGCIDHQSLDCCDLRGGGN